MSESNDTTGLQTPKPAGEAPRLEPSVAEQPSASRGSPGGGEVVAYVSDLIFATKVTATARFVGVRAAAVTSYDAAMRSAAGAVALIVDMHTPGETAAELIRTVRQSDATKPIVAFYSHVCDDLGERARSAGASEVLPRSKFSRELGAILQRLSS